MTTAAQQQENGTNGPHRKRTRNEPEACHPHEFLERPSAYEASTHEEPGDCPRRAKATSRRRRQDVGWRSRTRTPTRRNTMNLIPWRERNSMQLLGSDAESWLEEAVNQAFGSRGNMLPELFRR